MAKPWMQRALPDQKKMMLRFRPADLSEQRPLVAAFHLQKTLEPNLDNYCRVVAFF